LDSAQCPANRAASSPEEVRDRLRDLFRGAGTPQGPVAITARTARSPGGQQLINRLHGTRRADLIIPGSQVRVLPRPFSELPAIVGLSTRYQSHPQRLGASSGQSTAVIRYETGPSVNTDVRIGIRIGTGRPDLDPRLDRRRVPRLARGRGEVALLQRDAPMAGDAIGESKRPASRRPF
jgi:hypothetical protein